MTKWEDQDVVAKSFGAPTFSILLKENDLLKIEKTGRIENGSGKTKVLVKK